MAFVPRAVTRSRASREQNVFSIMSCIPNNGDAKARYRCPNVARATYNGSTQGVG